MEITIRKAQPSDAEQIIAYVKRLSEEPVSNIELSPSEFTVTVEEERELLAGYARSDNSLYLIAESEGQMVGSLVCTSSKRQAIRHVVTDPGHVGGPGLAAPGDRQPAHGAGG